MTPAWNRVVQRARSLALETQGAARRFAHRTHRLVQLVRGWQQRPGTLLVTPGAGAAVSAGPAGPMATAGVYLPPQGLLTPADPLNLYVDASRTAVPTLNVLLPGLCMRGMSGGPNTILNLTYRMAAQGVPVRYLSCSADMDADTAHLWTHVQALAGIPQRLPNVSFVCAHDRRRPVAIGGDDVFFASAWWTAQMVKYALPLVRPRRFLYAIQDYEPVLHEHSTAHALALETYSLDCVPIVNHPLLLEYFVRHGIGRFAEPAFVARAAVIDPAVDRQHFFVDERRPAGPRRLLFYARPRSAARNLFQLGVAALQRAAALGAFAAEPWEFLAMGDPIEDVALGGGNALRRAPWRDFAGYAEQMRHADVLLSLMLSPHPSYPPLEMAACGGLVVTNSYDVKTAERLAAVSPLIAAPAPTIEAVSDALCAAAARVGDRAARIGGATIAAPPSWEQSLQRVLPAAIAAFHACRRAT